MGEKFNWAKFKKNVDLRSNRRIRPSKAFEVDSFDLGGAEYQLKEYVMVNLKAYADYHPILESMWTKVEAELKDTERVPRGLTDKQYVLAYDLILQIIRNLS